jgi:lipoyl(octanoyl) transferase
MTPPLPVLDLGLAPYDEVQALQSRLRRLVAEEDAPGVLLLLEHPAVITLGSRGRPTDVPALAQGGSAAVRDATVVPVARSERGGAATLHAPGQLISYPVMPIPSRDLRRYVHNLEEVLVRLLAEYGIEAMRRPGAPGLYVGTHGQSVDVGREGRRVGPDEDRGGRDSGGIGSDDEQPPEAKIASIGLRCERWVASHGTSLNVWPDLSLFDMIISCGEVGLHQTSMEALLGEAVPMAVIKTAYAAAFGEVFQKPVEPIKRATVEGVERLLGTPPTPC